MPISNHWPAKVNSSKENIAVRGPFTKYKVEHNTGTDREEIRFFGRRLNVAQRPRELAMYKNPWAVAIDAPVLRMEWFDHTSEERQTFPWCRSWGDSFDMSRNRGDHLRKGGKQNMGRIHLIWYTIQFFKRIYGTHSVTETPKEFHSHLI